MKVETLTKERSIWKLDLLHSELTFKVKHLMISSVTGRFRNFDITAEFEGDDFTRPVHITLTADIGSIDTNNPQRNDHLLSADFFDHQKHQQLVFEATKFEGNAAGGRLLGRLTIRGVTNNIELTVEFGGRITDPYGQIKAGFSVDGKIGRKEYGLTWNALTETGGLVVGDEVIIHAEIELTKQS